MFRGDTGSYLDPLRACSLSGESRVDVGISESATNAKFDAIIKQRRRTTNRTSVLNDVEKARLDLLIKRIDGERAVTETILNRQRIEVQNSLIAIEDHRKEYQKYTCEDDKVINELLTDRKSKRKRIVSPRVSPRALNVTGIELKQKLPNSKEIENDSKSKMPMLKPLKHVTQEHSKYKQTNRPTYRREDKHLTSIRFPAIGKVLYKDDVTPLPGDITIDQSKHHSSGVRLPRAMSEPDSINSCASSRRKQNKKVRKGRKRGMSVNE
ncbi:uncharacterized protein LOC117125411 isoform X2 [Anneissia japonica]|uniref:uncharacterized protein LOC117125411 isoform X2 n=1 Tax=Anneissia japonica TaxID=1529436 RepID=UPI0014255E75|nr:uncharacterized protein LOC117125411 isoform X2 [Anneissia japonica]XP_033127819.1 uncharacterized protein LOC117125411 isoform X2 [Anneissia japonica]XP_033127820.1 uncharacterized protein LOC117125411 isoform X2 [Anneissia japonica]XP_033127821.1 uncharacterized protein LOC117125411 isoform X2 [Anneissia japonica]XP_033127823.1 uncharacterized protein LOC117125411 isoform X2 [Anneissia japonica]XP_033127824.1 uncharacterized protein LOC117125411 isoform X2 [Anneissia japonica]XP_03312782